MPASITVHSVCTRVCIYTAALRSGASTVVTYAHYACVADCADAMADAWEDTAGCAQAICLHENLLE